MASLIGFELGYAVTEQGDFHTDGGPKRERSKLIGAEGVVNHFTKHPNYTVRATRAICPDVELTRRDGVPQTTGSMGLGWGLGRNRAMPIPFPIPIPIPSG